MDRFIVGTGRCGSTLLSRMLAENPATMSAFEFFNGLDATRRFAVDPVSGEEFAALISAEQPFVTAVLRRGYEVSEITYPFGADSRHQRDDPLPWILVSMLPRLSPDPDRLYDEVMAYCAVLPRQHLSRHYRALFEWLRERCGCDLWIERSGSSIDYLGGLCDFFPDARFLHIHRDGPEAALSMREHHAYRLPIALLYRPEGGSDEAAAIARALRAEPERDDPISRILASRPPVEYYGRYWSDQVLRGAEVLPRLGAGQYRELRFEDLVTRPHEILRSISEFFELEPKGDGWIERAASLVRGIPPTRFDRLPVAEQAVLSDACLPGSACLGREEGAVAGESAKRLRADR